ncbi:hypothetical protein ACYSNX_10465 [Myroides sp. LJL115]
MKITCIQCFTEKIINDNELLIDLLETNEREMGPENMYEIIIDDIICSNCETLMSVKFNIWEYPARVVNYYEQYETNVVVTELPDFNILINNE